MGKLDWTIKLYNYSIDFYFNKILSGLIINIFSNQVGSSECNRNNLIQDTCLIVAGYIRAGNKLFRFFTPEKV